MRLAFLLMIAFTALGAGGCVSFTPDGGFTSVADSARQLGQVAWPRTPEEQSKVDAQVAGLLSGPLSAQDAVQIALLNNLMLQAQFEELGISEADLVQAGRLQNPRFDLRHASTGAQYDIEETLSFNVLSLLTMPYARAVEKQRFAQTQSAAVLRIAVLARDTRDAYYNAVAATTSGDYRQRIRAAAETSATLAQAMVASGSWNRLDQSHEQVFYTDAVAGAVRTQLAAEAAHAELLRLMGLAARSDGQPALHLAAALPDLPDRIEDLPDVEHAILQDRLDLRLMRQRLDELRERLRLTRSTRFINVLDAGATRERQGSGDSPFERGYTVTLEVPLFDSGDARVKRSAALYAQAVDRFTQAAIDARAQIRLAYAQYVAAFELARQQRDEVLPLRKAVAEENLLRYNASQISIFELLSDVREQAVSAERYIERVRDFWLAKSRLDGALLGNSAL